MENPVSLNRIAENSVFRKGDVFVLFGELFGRGYATGLLDEARRVGMEIIGITVGRRDENNALRPLNAEELAEAEARLGGRIINLPLMAGFDLDAPEGGETPTDLLAKLTLEGWQNESLDWDHIAKCREIGTKRFKDTLSEVMSVLDGMIAMAAMSSSRTRWPAAFRRPRCSSSWRTGSTRVAAPVTCRRRRCSTAISAS